MNNGPVAPNPQITGSPYGSYGDFIHELDWSVGRVLATLDRLKLTEHTLLILTSDNGGIVDRNNKDDIRGFCEYVHGMERVRGIFFYFHTPYYGRDTLYIELDERRRILQEILDLRKHYRILNSRAGLLSASRNDWKRPMDVCSVYEKGAVYKCCRYSADPELCRQCGYLSYAEIDQTLKLKPSAIFGALKYF